MDISVLYSMLSLGFGLGLLHALDADHVMAVSTMSARDQSGGKRPGPREVLGFCAKWAIGHGGVLLLLALALMVFGLQLPESVGWVAEKLVGVILVALGLWLLWNIYSQRIHLHAHTHDGVSHVHLSHEKSAEHTHQPVLIGITHGLAGSAPVLALIPALETSGNNIWFGMSYIVLFSLGVLIAMMVFGVFFGQLQNWLVGMGQKIYQVCRGLMGVTAIAFGSYWLFA